MGQDCLTSWWLENGQERRRLAQLLGTVCTRQHLTPSPCFKDVLPLQPKWSCSWCARCEPTGQDIHCLGDQGRVVFCPSDCFSMQSEALNVLEVVPRALRGNGHRMRNVVRGGALVRGCSLQVKRDPNSQRGHDPQVSANGRARVSSLDAPQRVSRNPSAGGQVDCTDALFKPALLQLLAERLEQQIVFHRKHVERMHLLSLLPI